MLDYISPKLQHRSVSNTDDFDVGPFSWVKSEITFALNRVDEGLIQIGNKNNDPEQIRHMQAHLHQVTGALKIVGLEPISLVCEALETFLKGLARTNEGISQDSNGIARRAINALKQYLDSLIRGERNTPLALYPEYESLVNATNPDSASPVDLFFPDLSRTPRNLDKESTFSEAERTAIIVAKQEAFQCCLAEVLQDIECSSNLNTMCNILLTIEVTQKTDERIFWWIAAGFVEGLAIAARSPDAFQKQLCSCIEVELDRRARGESVKLDRLLREMLFAMAHMPQKTPRLRNVHETYRLTHLLPLAKQESPEQTRVKVSLRDIKMQLEMAQETWIDCTTGDQPSFRRFANETVQLTNFARGLNNKSLRAIFAKLAEAGRDLAKNPRFPDEHLALEIATTLLTGKEALDNYFQLGPDFDNLSQSRVARVGLALRNAPLPGSGAIPLVDVRRTAEERKLFAQLAQECLSVLSKMETSLDSFFRDPTARLGLDELKNQVKQIEGVLTILESQDAVTLLKAGWTLVQKFASDNGLVSIEQAELTAEAFSTLEMFVVAVKQGHDDPDVLLQSILRRLGMPNRGSGQLAA